MCVARGGDVMVVRGGARVENGSVVYGGAMGEDVMVVCGEARGGDVWGGEQSRWWCVEGRGVEM